MLDRGISSAPGLRSSETTAFEAFIDRHRRDLERMLVVRYGLHIGMEAVAAATAYAWREWDHVSALEKPLPYLYRVGQSEARRHHRWQRTIALPPESRPPPDSTTRLHDALARLRPDQRSAVVLVHGCGYRYEEAAEMLGITLSTIRNEGSDWQLRRADGSHPGYRLIVAGERVGGFCHSEDSVRATEAGIYHIAAVRSGNRTIVFGELPSGADVAQVSERDEPVELYPQQGALTLLHSRLLLTDPSPQ